MGRGDRRGAGPSGRSILLAFFLLGAALGALLLGAFPPLLL